MKSFKLIVRAITLCVAVASSAGAARAQADAARPERPGGLAVEIVHDDGRRTYMPGNETVWFQRFRAVAGWQRPAHVRPVQAVQVASRVKTEDSLHITVSVRLGERHLDEDRAVATFVAREGDALVAEGLR